MEDDSFNDILANMEIPEDPIKRQAVEETPGTSSQAEVSNEAAQVEVSKPALIQTEVPRYKNAVQVHPNQKGNPILKAITHIPWEFNSSIVPDYVVGRTACVLFLSIRYHNLKPDYIHERLKQLGKSYELRVLLVHVDIKESHNALKHLTRLCLLADLTLMLAWTTEEAGKIIETYKMFEHRTADFIMERAETNDYQKASLTDFNLIYLFNGSTFRSSTLSRVSRDQK